MRTVVSSPITFAAVATLAGQYIHQQAARALQSASRARRYAWAVINRQSRRTFGASAPAVLEWSAYAAVSLAAFFLSCLLQSLRMY